VAFTRIIRQDSYLIKSSVTEVLDMAKPPAGFAERPRTLREQKNLSQTEPGLRAGLHYTYTGRFERGASRRSGDTLKRLADALDVTGGYLLADALDVTGGYLLEGAAHDAARAKFADRELLKQFQEVERLPDEDKHVVKTLLDAFLTKKHLQSLVR
jgi:transcriptional regulator with XRE-family HTH domain